MKRILLISVLCVCSMAGWSSAPVRYDLGVRGGYILRDGKTDPYMGKMPSLGATFSMEWTPEWESMKRLNGASVGLAVDYQYLTNNQWLGSMIGTYTFLCIPLVKLPHFALGLRPGIGLAVATKTYWTTRPEGEELPYLPGAHGEPTVNQCVGSHLNVYFNEALYLEFPFHNGWALGMTAGWQHYSNGSTIQPNSGYNILGGELYARKQIDDGRVSSKWWGRGEGFKRWDVELAAGGGFRQVYYRDRQTFGVASVSLSAHYRPWYVFKIGAGVDVFYDGAYVPRKTSFNKTYLDLAQPSDCWRLGVSLQPTLVVGNLTAGFYFGVYLMDGVKNLEYTNDEEKQQLQNGQRLDKPLFYAYDILHAGSAGHADGFFYTRLVLKYRVTNHLFVHAGLKGHLTKAEFVDAGLGVCF